MGGAVYSWPLVVDGVLYIGSEDHQVYTLDASTGELRWRYETEGDVTPSTVADGVVYAGSEDGHVYALEASTGELIRRYQVGTGMPAFPVAVDGVIYSGSEDGHVYALDASTGELVWNYEVGDDAAVLAVLDGLVLADTWDESYALDASTGELRWRYKVGDLEWFPTLPSSLVGRVLYVSSGASVEALDASSGKSLWSYETGASVRFGFSSPDVEDSVVYVGLFDGYLHAISASTGTQIWRSRIPGSCDNLLFLSPKVEEGVVYVTTDDYYLNAFSASTGELLWRHTAPNSSRLLTVVDGVLYAGTDRGRLYALRVADGS